MSNDDQDVRTDVLFVGMTRPATKWGVPYTALVIEFMFTAITFLAIGNPLFMLVVIPIHAVLYLVASDDPGVFDSIFLWLKTNGRSMNSRFWGAASFSPVDLKKWKR